MNSALLKKTITVPIFKPAAPLRDAVAGFVESHGYVSMEAEHFTRKHDRGGTAGEVVNGLGRSGDSVIHVRHRLTPGGVTKLKADGETIGCRLWCDAYELRQTDRRMRASYAGGPLNGLAAVVECLIGKGRVILHSTQPDDACLGKLIGRLAPGAKSDPGVVVTERVTADGKPAGAFIVNTNRDAATYRDDSEAKLLKGYTVEIADEL